MAIDWDYLLVEMTLLAAMVYGAIYVENWVAARKKKRDDAQYRNQIIRFVRKDLEDKLHFIADTINFKDYKPFFTDMWDAVILGGKQTLLPFELFENLQHTYSWMKYYNSEIEQRQRDSGEKELLEIIEEVRKSIRESIARLAQPIDKLG
ncbi:MAG: hypothetical protein ABI361_04260 [Nitrososphaera sp.]